MKKSIFLRVLLVIMLVIYTISITVLIILNLFIDYSKITYQTKHNMVTIEGKVGYDLYEYEWNGNDLILHFEEYKE